MIRGSLPAVSQWQGFQNGLGIDQVSADRLFPEDSACAADARGDASSLHLERNSRVPLT